MITNRDADYHIDIQRRSRLQKQQAWAYLVTHNYTLLFGTHPIADLGEERYTDLLTSYYKDGVGHIDTARAIHACEVAPNAGKVLER